MVSKLKSVEIEANTVEEAIEKALKILNVSREQVEVKVLSEEKKGLFGMQGSKGAKFKVALKKNLDQKQ